MKTWWIVGIGGGYFVGIAIKKKDGSWCILDCNNSQPMLCELQEDAVAIAKQWDIMQDAPLATVHELTELKDNP